MKQEINTSDFLADLRKALVAAEWSYALEMVSAIEARAATDIEYGRKLVEWVKRGKTVLLRDTLCAPFSQFAFVKNLEPTMAQPYANMWDAIDSAWLRVTV